MSDSNLVTIAGGKWTTYRAMAAETVDAAVTAGGLEAGGSMTDGSVVIFDFRSESFDSKLVELIRL